MISPRSCPTLVVGVLYLFASIGFAKAARVSEDEDSVTQFKLEEFAIELSPTPEPLEGVENLLSTSLEFIAGEYLRMKMGESFEYLFLADVEGTEWNGIGARRLSGEDTPSTTVKFVGGVVAIKAEEETETPISEDDVYAWFQEAIETRLVSDVVSFKGNWIKVQEASFVDLGETPRDKPVNGVGGGEYITSDEGKKVGTVMGTLAGIAMIIAGAAWLVKSERHWGGKKVSEAIDEAELEKSNLEGNSASDPDGSSSDEQSEMAQYSYGPGELLDCVSVAPSVTSEWTLTTSDEASNAMKQKRLAMAYASSETFERDRKVTLQKDMLQSGWTTVHNTVDTQQQQSDNSENSENRENSGEATEKGSLSFEKAYEEGQGEEIYLMPPSRRRVQSRTELV